jgi:hypothetical protein
MAPNRRTCTRRALGWNVRGLGGAVRINSQALTQHRQVLEKLGVAAGFGHREGRSVDLIGVHELLGFVLYFLAMAHGYLWSKEERRRAVQEAYDQIRTEVREERKC